MCVERKDVDGNWIETKKNVLPQGAPTSPVLTNVVCQRLDYLLSAVAKRFGLKYSRYADDITFSSLHNVFQKDSPFLKELQRVIDDQGFSIKESKTRLQVDGIRKSVTGLVVNEKVNVKKRYIKQLRMWLYLWERYGYTKAENIFKGDYIKDKGHIMKGKPNLASVVDGKLNYLKMVKGGDDTTYVKLKDRFDALVQGSSQLEMILKEWEQNGIKSAIEIYKA
jgi:retron-type reverse transcriptase